MKKLSIQVLDCDRLVCTTVMYYSGLISAVPTNELLLGEKRMCANLQIDSTRIYNQTEERIDRHG